MDLHVDDHPFGEDRRVDLGTAGTAGSRLARAMAPAHFLTSVGVVGSTTSISSSHAVKASGALSQPRSWLDPCRRPVM